MAELLEIDGSVLEGGGQILRISISLSAILGIPVRVTQIRAGRKKPGLAPQHLMGIKLVADMCQAKLKGARIGSTEIEFRPGKIRGGHYVADTQTAGSISLLLQVALPCALLADGPVTLDLKGGTNADMAPQLDYMYHVFRPVLQRFKADFSLTIHSRGYYPKGGGHVTVDVQPVRKLAPVQALIQGTPVRIFAYSFVSPKLPTKIAYQMADAAKEQIKDKCSDIEIVAVKEDKCYTNDFCSGIILSASLSNGCTLGADGLFKRGVTPEDLGRSTGEAMRALIESGVNVDSRMQDQVIILMALADGASAVTAGEITLHTQTAIHIAEILAKTKFKLTYHDNKCDIECDGIGFVNQNIPE